MSDEKFYIPPCSSWQISAATHAAFPWLGGGGVYFITERLIGVQPGLPAPRRGGIEGDPQLAVIFPPFSAAEVSQEEVLQTPCSSQSHQTPPHL